MRIRFSLLLATLVFIIGCASAYNPITGKREWYLFDDPTEISWGQAMAKQFIAEHKMIEDQESLNRLRNLGQAIAKNSHRSYLIYHFYLVDQDQVNAFAMPGGYVFIYQGLFEKVNQDQLAFVLAHEIGHVAARHSLKRLGAAMGIGVLTTVLLGEPQQSSARQLTNQFFNIISLGYSRSDELEADSLGIEYTINSGYDPRAAIDLFALLDKENKQKGQVPFYLRTHPYTDQRIKNIGLKIKDLTE